MYSPSEHGRSTPVSFGRRLREERDRLGLTQSQLAEAGGVKRLSQHLYETEVRLPAMDYLVRLKECGVDVVYLMFGTRGHIARPSEIRLTAPQLASIYQVVDEFAVDDRGDPLSVDYRLQLFKFLCAALSDSPGELDESDLRQKLTRFASS